MVPVKLSGTRVEGRCNGTAIDVAVRMRETAVGKDREANAPAGCAVVCAECGGRVAHEGGCAVCRVCGASACG